MLIDVHCHLTALTPEIQKTVLAATERTYLFIDSSINYSTTLSSVALSKEHAFIYSSIGFHPFCIREFNQGLIAQYRKIITDNTKVVSIGEIGLDYKADAPQREQEKIFREFLTLVCACNLPVVIHNRLDRPDILAILDEAFPLYEKVVFHCFSYSKTLLAEILKRGGFVSFSLNVLRKNKELLDSLKACPLESMLLETDSPYMKLNNRLSTPLDIHEVYAFVASIKNIEAKELERIMYENTLRAFPGIRK